MQSEKPVYLAISRKAFNAALDKSDGAFDRPLNTPRSDNDYFIIAITPKKGWDAVPLLDALPDADSRIPKYYISLKIPSISYDPNFLPALNMTQAEFKLCQKVGDVRKVDNIDELITAYRAIEMKAYAAANREEKLVSLDAMAKKVADFREDWQKKHRKPPIIGFTSGTFDIPHANHTRLLDAAKNECDFLAVAIASDRTVREQKDADRPFVPEQERAAHIAGLGSVDAVTVSDETYHENLLARIAPNVMFKGDDYKGKKIIGVPEGCAVKIIDIDRPLHSSHIVDSIRRSVASGPDTQKG